MPESAASAQNTAIRHDFAEINGVRLHYASAGAGRLILFLHGFPEFWYGWRNQIPALAAAGFQVVAPDLRGYNLSDKPARVSDYRVDRLAADVAALIHQVAPERGRANLVGHDWGGVIAWHVAMHHAETVQKLVILNAPHPAAYLRALRTPAQLLRSWYVLFFQIPRLPEAAIRFNGFAALRSLFRRASFSESEIDAYVEAFSRPGALTAALNYYRAAFRLGPARISRLVRRIEIPTVLIWGERDSYLVSDLTRGLEPWISDLRTERVPQATHWVQHDEPDTVNRLLVSFLS